jgi:hypothetical protein
LDRQTFGELVLWLIACRKSIAASAVTSMPEIAMPTSPHQEDHFDRAFSGAT